MSKSHAAKLAAAIAYLRECGIYCLEIPIGVNRYRPLHGTPLPPVRTA